MNKKIFTDQAVRTIVPILWNSVKDHLKKKENCIQLDISENIIIIISPNNSSTFAWFCIDKTCEMESC